MSELAGCAPGAAAALPCCLVLPAAPDTPRAPPPATAARRPTPSPYPPHHPPPPQPAAGARERRPQQGAPPASGAPAALDERGLTNNPLDYDPITNEHTAAMTLARKQGMEAYDAGRCAPSAPPRRSQRVRVPVDPSLAARAAPGPACPRRPRLLCLIAAC